MGFSEEFLEFLEEYKILGLAIAFVIGSAVNELVSSTVDDLVMPVLEVFLLGGGWETATYTLAGVELRIGSFLSSLIDFVIIALLIFIFVRYLLGKDTEEIQ